MTDEERVFRRDNLFSKRDILQMLERQMDYIEHDPETGYTKALIRNKLSLYREFYKKVERSVLPTLTRLYWYYDYMYTGTGMELWLNSDEEIELSDDHEYISSATIGTEDLLLSVDSELVSPEEFAAIQEVSSATVHTWLKKGKLKYAKYVDGKWLIPSTAEKPERDRIHSDYTIDTDDPPVIEECPIVSVCESVTIRKKGRSYKCDFFNYKTDFYETVILSREETERLEYALIKSGKAIPEAPLQRLFEIDREE